MSTTVKTYSNVYNRKNLLQCLQQKKHIPISITDPIYFNIFNRKKHTQISITKTNILQYLKQTQHTQISIKEPTYSNIYNRHNILQYL